jgi:hypothetical protein
MPFVKGASASTASRPASVTIAKRPSEWDGTEADIDRFALSEKQNIFANGAGQVFADLPVESYINSRKSRVLAQPRRVVYDGVFERVETGLRKENASDKSDGQQHGRRA